MKDALRFWGGILGLSSPDGECLGFIAVNGINVTLLFRKVYHRNEDHNGKMYTDHSQDADLMNLAAIVYGLEAHSYIFPAYIFILLLFLL